MLQSLMLLQPTTVAEASRALSDFGERAKIYAGGAELLLLMRQKLLEAEILIDIKKIAELHRFAADETGMGIGACVTHNAIANSPLARSYAPSFTYAEAQVANVRVRNQGTLGGNLCFNDPHSDPGAALLVHNASVRIANYKGERDLSLEDFFLDMYATALRPNEILREVWIPPLPDGMSSAYIRLHRYQRPTLGIAAAVKIAGGVIADCRLAVGCAGPKALRLRELETKLTGAQASDAKRLCSEEKRQLRDLLRPVDDLLGSAEYKAYMTCVMLGDAVTQAARELTRATQ
jgi:carbon-monoxide dehydrogenase medium subunit